MTGKRKTKKEEGEETEEGQARGWEKGSEEKEGERRVKGRGGE